MEHLNNQPTADFLTSCLRQAGLTFNDTKGLAFSIYNTPA